MEMTWPPNPAQPHPAWPRVGPLRAKAKFLSSENFSSAPGASRFSTGPPHRPPGLAHRKKQHTDFLLLKTKNSSGNFCFLLFGGAVLIASIFRLAVHVCGGTDTPSPGNS